jgi:putative nucleotidyltransferase with HDIG domain
MENKGNGFIGFVRSIKDFTSRYGRKISQVLLILLCSGLIIYFMPRERSVFYNYKQNTPWAHEQLRAEFDFDVPKTAEEISAEEDSVKQTSIPVFQRIGTSKGYYDIAIATIFKGNTDTRESQPFFDSLKGILNQGIIADSDTVYLNGDRHNKILTYSDSTERRRLESRNFITVSQAYAILSRSTADTTGLAALITPNYRCDARATLLEQEKHIKSIDPVYKHIKEGERIISTGDIVDKDAERSIKAYLDQKKEKEKTESANNWKHILLGQILFIITCMLILSAYINIYKKEIANSNNKFIFTIIAATVFPVIAGIMTMQGDYSIFIIPFAILPITLCLFIDESTAFFTSCISFAMCSIMMSAPYEFLLLQILAGGSAILSLKDLSSRAQMFKCVIIVFLTYAIVYLCYKTINTAAVSGIRTLMFAYFAASSILTLLIYPLMIIIERTFGFISSVTLIELSNLNSKLLQRMSQEAPGTFQHSMQVGNLAAEAAIAIGANPLEVRTGAMYHDIGKLESPIYFTENQNGGVSPHSSLTPIESAQVIIKHVTDGLATAEREGLPKKIKEFIATHHGDSKVGYFYITYKNEHPGEEIDEKLFTYPGPKPSTKEQAVLMLADCVEAASHSLKEYTEENINKLVDNIVGAKLNEGELSMSPITFGDVDTIKTVFKKRVMAIYHTRISYPKEKEQ